MKTDAMDAAVVTAEAGGDGTAAGNIVVGSQLQIVGMVSTRSMADRPSKVIASYWSVGSRAPGIYQRAKQAASGLIVGGQ